jgi:hypothetical protein
VKLLAWDLSWDLDIDLTIKLGTYQGYGAALGFNGTALFFEDTHRSQPSAGEVSVPGFLAGIGGLGQSQARNAAQGEAQALSAKDAGEAVATMQPPASTLDLAIDVFEKLRSLRCCGTACNPFDRSKAATVGRQRRAHRQRLPSWSPTTPTWRSTRPRPSMSPT